MPEYRDFLLSKCQLCKGRSAVKGCLWPLVANFATTLSHLGNEMSRMAGELSECLEHHVQGPEGGTWCTTQDCCQQHAHERECIPHRLPGWICFLIFVAAMCFPVTKR